MREGRAYHIEAVMIGTIVSGRKIEHTELVVSHIQHNATWSYSIHIASRIDASILSANRHLAI